VLKHCAVNRKRRLSALPNVGPYIYDVKISVFTRSYIYIYDISRLRVNDLCYISSVPKLNRSKKKVKEKIVTSAVVASDIVK
jgi:hypothetical protein